MRVESLFLLGIAVFFGCVGLAYWFLSYEDGGFLMLIGTCLLGLLPGSYYYYWHRRMGDRPEDRPDAEISDGAGVINSFPSSSIWPFVLGMGAFMTVMTFVFGAWFFPIGAGLIITALIGVTVESRRGGHV
ncbi:MAG: aa3-type cytochrome oxidase subunit IV [Acidimicrobiales bacterium]